MTGLSGSGDPLGPGVAALPSHLLVTGSQMRVDAVTAEVVTALRADGIEPLLLKGPTIAGWLYDERHARPYTDTDLLVAPDAVEPAEAVLRSLAFEPFSDPIPFDRPWPATAWVRSRDGGSVDLHHTLIGVNVSLDRAWEVLSADTETWRIGGTEVEALAPVARAVHVVLHSAQHGRGWKGPREDVTRAIERLPRSLWVEAARISEELQASGAFAAGLRMTPAGEDLARELDLPLSAPADVLLSANNPPPLAVGLEWLTRRKGVWAKVVLVARKIALPPSEMRRWTPLARRGRTGLALAYVWRPFWLIAKLPRAVRALRRARAEASPRE
ncbi:MAG: nucleotidyltransferase family protein [Actinomycetota bacterium]|nr:nucleotidyltransferase family protein [Actinomycetota bacterium]